MERIQEFFAKNWMHLLAVAIFLIVAMIYFMPEYQGYNLSQHDVQQHKGMSNEIAHHRDLTGEEAMWTNSMFGGMPAVQVSMLYNGNIFQKITIGFLGFFGVSSGIFLLHLIGVYILAMCMRLKPLVGVFGALAVSFSTYEILILSAGHNSKAIAVAFMAPVIGGFIYSYRRNWKWGAILSALFMSFQLSANHLQVSYYMGILLLGIGFLFLINAIKSGKYKQFGFATLGLMGAYLLAIFINYGNLTLTNDFANLRILSDCLYTKFQQI